MSTQLVLTGMEIKEIKNHFENLSYGNKAFIWIVWGKLLAYLFFGLLNGGVTAANIVLHNSKACSNQEENMREG